MPTKKAVISVPDQIKKALDGRTQRWLSLELGILEDTFSKKMRGILQFTKDDIEAINERLGAAIENN